MTMAEIWREIREGFWFGFTQPGAAIRSWFR
jgi:hypothetical protein